MNQLAGPRRLVRQSVACQSAAQCLDVIQERVANSWDIVAIEDHRNGTFAITFSREEPETPFGAYGPDHSVLGVVHRVPVQSSMLPNEPA